MAAFTRVLNWFADTTGKRAFCDPFDFEPEENEVHLVVPSMLQSDGYSCAAIAAYSVARALGCRFGFERIHQLVNPVEDEGAEEWKIVRALRACGIRVSIRQDLDFEKIQRNIDRGYPIIVGVGRDENGDGDHWAVIYGYGLKPRRIFLANQPLPIIGGGKRGLSRQELSWGDFRRREWAGVGSGLVCSDRKPELRSGQ